MHKLMQLLNYFLFWQNLIRNAEFCPFVPLVLTPTLLQKHFQLHKISLSKGIDIVELNFDLKSKKILKPLPPTE